MELKDVMKIQEATNKRLETIEAMLKEIVSYVNKMQNE